MTGKRTPLKYVKFSLYAVAATCVMVGSVYLLRQWDPTYLIWKRWKEFDKYRYEEIHPRFLETKPIDLIRIKTAKDATRIRHDLIFSIWEREGAPISKQPASVDKNFPLAASGPNSAEWKFYTGIDNLASVDVIHIPVGKKEFGYVSRAFHFHPKKGDNRLLIYHNGHGGTGTFHDKKERIAELIEAGYAVIALNLPAYGRNRIGEWRLKRFGRYLLGAWRLLDLVERPMRFWIEPVFVTVNYAHRAYAYASIDMIGFSAGGWLTTVAAAVDPRIRRSYPIAGGYPLYLRSGEEHKQSPRPQYHAPLIRAANYLEMYVLAAFEGNRRQLQIFNRFDRCCYANTKGKLYEAAIKTVLADIKGGNFNVLLDETHPRHTISKFAMKALLRDLAKP